MFFKKSNKVQINVKANRLFIDSNNALSVYFKVKHTPDNHVEISCEYFTIRAFEVMGVDIKNGKAHFYPVEDTNKQSFFTVDRYKWWTTHHIMPKEGSWIDLIDLLCNYTTKHLATGE